MVRYYGTFYDFTGLLNEIYIYDDTIASPPTAQGIRAFYERSADSPFQPIQSSKLTLELEASNSDDLSDLWTEEDRYWKVSWYKNSSLIWFGYLVNEGMEESFSDANWILRVECLDPLSLLENYKYSNAGTPYTGVDSVKNIIGKALSKGFVSGDEMDTRVIPGFTLTDDTLFWDGAYIDQEAFLKNEEPVDCKTVVENILKSCGMTIRQYGGYYYIFDVLEHVELIAGSKTWYSYSLNGTYNGSGAIAANTYAGEAGSIRSSVNTSIEQYHVNGNQTLIRRKYWQAVRLKHVYEWRSQILPNGELLESTGTMPNWTLGADASVNGDAVDITGKALVTEDTIQLTSSGVALKAGNIINIAVNMTFVDDPAQISIRVTVDNGVDTYYLRATPNGFGDFWQTAATDLIYYPDEGAWSIGLNEIEIPIDGNLTVYFYHPVYGGNLTGSSKVTIQEVLVSAVEQEEEGAEHTKERTDVSAGFLPDVIEIPIGTENTSAILNNFLDSSGDPLGSIKALYNAGTYDLLNYLSYQRLACYSASIKEYNGDVLGNLEGINPYFIQNIDVLGLQHAYVITNISKDIEQNIQSVTMVGLITGQAGTTSDETKTVFKETIKPTIES